MRSIAASPARTALKISQLTRRPPGGMPLMNSLATRGRELDALRAIRTAKDPDEAQRLLAAELPGEFAAVRTRPRNHFTSCLYRDAGSFANGIKTPTIATDLIPAAQSFQRLARRRGTGRPPPGSVKQKLRWQSLTQIYKLDRQKAGCSSTRGGTDSVPSPFFCRAHWGLESSWLVDLFLMVLRYLLLTQKPKRI